MAEELVSDDDGLLGDVEQPEDEGQVEEVEEQDEVVDDDPDPEPEPKKQGRLAARREALRVREEEVAAEKARAQRAEDELARLRSQQTLQQQEQERRAAIARENDESIPYEQRMYACNARRDKEIREELARDRAESRDLADQSAFRALASSDPRVPKYKDRVEQRLTQMRQQGNNASREAIYTYLLGEDVKNRLPATAAKQKDAAAARVSKARGEPTNARSDARSGSGSKGKLKDLEKRLTDVPL